MAQFGSLWKEVRLSIGKRTDIDDEIKRALNDAMVDIGLMFKIRQLITSTTFTTEANVNGYPLATNCLDVISVRNDTDAQVLKEGDWLEYASVDHADSDALGTPNKWFVDGSMLYLYSSSPDDTTFSISYRYLLLNGDMVSDTDDFPLSREWERPVKLLAKSYVMELLGQSEKAIAAYQQAMGIAAMRKSQGAWADLYKHDQQVNMGASYEDDF